MRPALVALDLDGTLLDGEGRVTERAADAIAGLVEAGVEVLLATGRPTRMTRHYVEQLELHHALVFNGAGTYHRLDDRTVHHHELDRACALAVLRRLQEHAPGVGLRLETSHGWYSDPTLEEWRRSDPRRSEQPPPAGVGAVEGFVRDAVIKILARHPDHDAPGMAAALAGIDAYATWTNDQVLEVMHPGANKRDGLRRFARSRGIAREDIAAFGDEHNDVQMLAWAGHGVAMANGARDAQDAADEVTASNEEDGVARVLERWLES